MRVFKSSPLGEYPASAMYAPAEDPVGIAPEEMMIAEFSVN